MNNSLILTEQNNNVSDKAREHFEKVKGQNKKENVVEDNNENVQVEIEDSTSKNATTYFQLSGLGQAYFKYRLEKINLMKQIKRYIASTIINKILNNKIIIEIKSKNNEVQIAKQKDIDSFMQNTRFFSQFKTALLQSFLSKNTIIKVLGDLKSPEIYFSFGDFNISRNLATNEIIWSMGSFLISQGNMATYSFETFNSLTNEYIEYKYGWNYSKNPTEDNNFKNNKKNFLLKEKNKKNKLPYVILDLTTDEFGDIKDYFFSLEPQEINLILAFEKTIDYKLDAGIKWFPNAALLRTKNITSPTDWLFLFRTNSALGWQSEIGMDIAEPMKLFEVQMDNLIKADSLLKSAYDEYKRAAYKIEPNFAGANQKTAEEVETMKLDETTNERDLIQKIQSFLNQVIKLLDKDIEEVTVKIIPYVINESSKKESNRKDFDSGLKSKSDTIKENEGVSDLEASTKALNLNLEEIEKESKLNEQTL